MKLDDDPLFSEWASAMPPIEAPAYAGYGNVAPSVAPYEIGFEEEEDPFAQVPPERRERLQRYVKLTMAGCVAVCLAAMVRVGVSRANAGEDVPVVAAHQEAPTLPLVAIPVAPAAPAALDIPAPVPVEEPAEQVAEPEPASSVAAPAPVTASAAPAPAAPSSAPAVASVAIPSAAAVAAAPVAAPPPVVATPLSPPELAKGSKALPAVASLGAKAAPSTSPPPGKPAAKTPTEEREQARRALEHGKLREAAAAAERAAALDPSDAEAWLILGAARQELGQASAAHAAFKSCVQSGKHGPIGECRAMLR